MKKFKDEWVIDKSKPKSFIIRWLCDANIRLATGYGVYPPPLDIPDGHINLWFDFPFANILDVYKYKGDEVDKILNLIRILCNNEDKQFDYFMKWLAHMFQFPADKLGIFHILVSEEGCGKGTYCKLMKKLVGDAKYLETSQPESHVWGKFNFLMANAYFVYINEFGKKNQTDAEGRIKNILTDETMVIKGEGDKPFTIQSVHSFMGSTNNPDPTNTKKGDRRKWIIIISRNFY